MFILKLKNFKYHRECWLGRSAAWKSSILEAFPEWKLAASAVCWAPTECWTLLWALLVADRCAQMPFLYLCLFWEPHLQCLCQLLTYWHSATNSSFYTWLCGAEAGQIQISALPSGCWRETLCWVGEIRPASCLLAILLNVSLEQVSQPWCYWHFGVGNSLLRGCCLVHCGAFRSIPILHLWNSNGSLQVTTIMSVFKHCHKSCRG